VQTVHITLKFPHISSATWDNKCADCTHYITISPHFNTWWEFCQESQ
jgi:hypothetical protein